MVYNNLSKVALMQKLNTNIKPTISDDNDIFIKTTL